VAGQHGCVVGSPQEGPSVQHSTVGCPDEPHTELTVQHQKRPSDGHVSSGLVTCRHLGRGFGLGPENRSLRLASSLRSPREPG
jgi:hypothetical protein